MMVENGLISFFASRIFMKMHAHFFLIHRSDLKKMNMTMQKPKRDCWKTCTTFENKISPTEKEKKDDTRWEEEVEESSIYPLDEKCPYSELLV